MKEARRRKVFQSVVAYVAVSLVLMELVGNVQQALLFPDWTSRLVTFLLMLGLPVVAVLAWVFDIGAKGVVRTAPADEATRDQPAGSASQGSRRAGAVAGTTSSARLDLKPRVPAPARKAPRRGKQPAEAVPAQPADPERVRRATLAHMRHELRTPINAILGYSEMLMEEDAPEAAVPDLRRIREAGRQLLGLVDTILASDKAADAERDLDSFGAQIRADLRTPINAVVGYAELLIENEREAGREALIPDLERIQVAASRLLDLSGDIVKLATAAPDAAMGADLADTASMTSGVLSKIRPVEGGSPTAHEGEGSLLVVDDNAMSRDLLSRQLARHGYIVATASNGREALEVLGRQRFDMVLLDVIMPEMDGVETLRRIKADDRLRDVPVVMLSSLDEVDSAVHCIEMGADEYLAKPVNPSLLEARIAANLEIRRMRERERIYRENAEASEAAIEQLLLASFPGPIAARVRSGESDITQSFAETTALWCSLAGAPGGDVAEGVGRVRALVALAEELAGELGIETCLVRHDGFTAVAAAPTPRDDHAEVIARFALELLARVEGGDDPSWGLRLGLHTGPGTGAVIGGGRLRYEVWGDAVDTAQALAGLGRPGAVLVSPTSHSLLRERFAFDKRGVIDVPGKGQMRTYVLGQPLPGDVAAAAGER
ncbi:MAG: response regulator [Gemmatimonadota bacterium]